mmetsp:Transcript_30738/g.89212  ORF Transcript_30738/g.89212 Transcript_30738/m.89212 type:complete len:205 (+) Transcript_30738:1791-2405(+)
MGLAARLSAPAVMAAAEGAAETVHEVAAAAVLSDGTAGPAAQLDASNVESDRGLDDSASANGKLSSEESWVPTSGGLNASGQDVRVTEALELSEGESSLPISTERGKSSPGTEAPIVAKAAARPRRFAWGAAVANGVSLRADASAGDATPTTTSSETMPSYSSVAGSPPSPTWPASLPMTPAIAPPASSSCAATSNADARVLSL